MKVLHVAETALGGCGTYLNEIVPLQLQELGQDNVRVVAPNGHLKHLTVDRAAVWSFRRPGRRLGIGLLTVSVCLSLWRFRPDVVHAHSSIAGLVVRLLSFLSGRRFAVVYCPHGWAFEIQASAWRRRSIAVCERWLALCCDRIIAISDAERRQGEANGIAREKILLIPNGIAAALPDQRAADWPSSRRKLLFVGRLDYQKGVDVLIEAVQGLEERLSVRIVGQAVASQAEANASRACPHVDYLGWMAQSDVIRQINACDVLVIPSRWEGFGLVAIEAMRAGKPVIASAVGGLVEIVVDGITGTLVTPEDAQSLRSAILVLGADELLQMGQAGRAAFLRSFTSDRVHRCLLNLYTSLPKYNPQTLSRYAGQPVG